MKRYLWTAVAVLLVNANASENPFELKENLLQINSEQDALLSELSALAEAREDAELEDDDIDAELEKEANAKEAPARKKKDQSDLSGELDAALEAEDAEMDAELAAEAKKHGLPLAEPEKEAPVKTEDTEEEYNVLDAISELVSDSEEEAPAAADQAAKEAEAAALKVAQEKAAQEQAQKEKAAQAKVQKEADEREEEKREVAAYEKQRAEKLARQAEEKAMNKPVDQVVEIDVEAEKVAAKEAADIGYENAVKEMNAPGEIATSKPVAEKPATEEVKTAQTEMPTETPVKKVASADGEIDVDAEKRALKEAADAAYLEAVREMDQEED